MKNSKYVVVAVMSSFIFSGCFSTYSFTFDSIPSGASVKCDGKHQGYTPLIMNSKVEFNKLPDVFPLEGCSANWISGYSVNYTNVRKINYPNGFTQTVERPNDGEGYEKDMYFSLQYKNMDSQQRQATAAQQQLNEQKQQNTLNNINRNIQNLNNNMQMQENNYQMQNLNNNLNNLNRGIQNNNNGGYYNGGGYYNNR